MCKLTGHNNETGSCRNVLKKAGPFGRHPSRNIRTLISHALCVMRSIRARLRRRLIGIFAFGPHFLVAMLIASLETGCSTVGEAINPYGSSFNCKMTENGKCITMTGAYRESLQPKDSKNDRGQKEKAGEVRDLEALEATYQGSLYKKLSGLLEEPDTPVIAPPKVMRVLLLPYKGTDKELFMYRYAYFLVDDYSWVLGDNVIPGGE
jgi:conjugal transfer pilus assembly protein TraV